MVQGSREVEESWSHADLLDLLDHAIGALMGIDPEETMILQEKIVLLERIDSECFRRFDSPPEVSSRLDVLRRLLVHAEINFRIIFAPLLSADEPCGNFAARRTGTLA